MNRRTWRTILGGFAALSAFILVVAWQPGSPNAAENYSIQLSFVVKGFEAPTPSPTPTPTRTPTPTPAVIGTPTPTRTPPPAGSSEQVWHTVGANAQRTSWVSEELSGTLKIAWYRPVEAYIPDNVQIITAYDTLYVATARGLYALYATDPDGTGPLRAGDTKWRFDTEMPLGHSPTVYNGRVYVAGFDKKLHALDAYTGQPIWSFDGAKAGYRTNPLVLTRNNKTMIYIGNRDGRFYTIEDQGSAPHLVRSFPTGGPIVISAAASMDGSKIYFASQDNHAYAVSADTGVQIWRSPKLPGEGFQSYWPTVYVNPADGKEYITLMGSVGYRTGFSPGSASVTYTSPSDGTQVPYSSMDQMQKDSLFFDKSSSSPIGPTIAPPGDNSWAHGMPIIDASRISQYLENNPATDQYLHKPWRRTFLVLDASTGVEYSQDVDGDGFSEYAPIAWWGTRNGNQQYPPVVNPDHAVLYVNNIYQSSNREYDIPYGRIMGWRMGTPYFKLLNAQGALDEPQAISGGGNVIYRSVCCDRTASWHHLLSSNNGTIWPYGPAAITTQAPDYNIMLWGVLLTGDYPHEAGYYGGRGKDGAPHNGKNGFYQTHGDQNPFVPYNGYLYIHRANAIIAVTVSPGSATKLPLLAAQSVQDSVATASAADLRARLEAEILKFDVNNNGSLDFLRPGYMNLGHGGYFAEFRDFFMNPGETLHVLSRAYPHLTTATQTKVRSHLQQYFQTYFSPTLYSKIGWSEGAPERQC